MQEIRHVDIRDVLRARDERVERQNAFLRRHGCALISFTMNVAGSIKRDALIERAFREGQRRIARELERMSVPVPEFCETLAFTGCECLWAPSLSHMCHSGCASASSTLHPAVI